MFTNNKHEIVYINDQKLELPPESIQISRAADIEVSPIIGDSARVLQFGIMKKEVQISAKLPLTNPDGSVNQNTFELFNMLANMPFAYVTNDFIISSLNLKNHRYAMFGVDIVLCTVTDKYVQFQIKLTYVPIEVYFLTNRLKFYDKNGNLVNSPHKAYFKPLYCNNNYQPKYKLEDIIKIKIPTSYRKLKILDLNKYKMDANALIRNIFEKYDIPYNPDEIAQVASMILTMGNKDMAETLYSMYKIPKNKVKELLNDQIKEKVKADLNKTLTKYDNTLLLNSNNVDCHDIIVDHVIDGDTVVARFPDGHTEKVRLLGVNTKEMGSYNQDGTYTKNPQPYAEKATEYTRNFVNNKTLKLCVSKNDKYKRDVSPAERLLGVIYDPSNKRILNYELVKEGLAEILPFENDIIDYDKFVLAQEYANLNDLNIWEKTTPTYGREREAVKYYFSEFEIDTTAMSERKTFISNIHIEIRHQNIYQTLRGSQDGIMQNLGNPSIQVTLNVTYSKNTIHKQHMDYEENSPSDAIQIIKAIDEYYNIYREVSPLSKIIPLIELNGSIFDITKLNTHTFIDYTIATSNSPGTRLLKIELLYTKPTPKEPFLKLEQPDKDNTDVKEVERKIKDIFLKPIREKINKLKRPGNTKSVIDYTTKKNVHVFKKGELVSTTATPEEALADKAIAEASKKRAPKNAREAREKMKEKLKWINNKNSGYQEKLVYENGEPKLKRYYNGQEINLQVDNYGKSYFIYNGLKIDLYDAKYKTYKEILNMKKQKPKQEKQYNTPEITKEKEEYKEELNDLIEQFGHYADMPIDELLDHINDLNPVDQQKVLDILSQYNTDINIINKALLREDVFKCGSKGKTINYYVNIGELQSISFNSLKQWIAKTDQFLQGNFSEFASKWKEIFTTIADKMVSPQITDGDKSEIKKQAAKAPIVFGPNDQVKNVTKTIKTLITYENPKRDKFSRYNNKTSQTVEKCDHTTQYIISKAWLKNNKNYYAVFNLAKTLLLFQKKMYPGYKVYIIEDNSKKELGNISAVTGRSVWADLDTYFSTHKIMGIAIHRSKDKPDDVLTIYMYNPTMWTKATKNKIDKETGKTIKEDIEKEFQLLSGTKIQLWMGYGQNPNDYELIFNGIVTESAPTDDTSLLSSGGVRTLICQSHGRELLNPLDEDIGSELIGSTQTVHDLIKTILTHPLCPHFGYYDPYSYTSRYGSAPQESNVSFGFFKRLPGGYEDNIFWSEQEENSVLHPGIFTSTDETVDSFTYTGQTMWEILKDISYKFPHKVMQVVPYGDRVTLYFGPRFGYYFWRPPYSLLEKYFVTMINKGTTTNMSNKLYWQSEGIIFDKDESFTTNLLNEYRSAFETLGLVKPFTDVHFALSKVNIIANNIIANNEGVFTKVIVRYDGDVDKESMVVKTSKKVEVKLHEDLPDEYTRTATFPAPNCRSEKYARMYAAKFLEDSIQQMYKGNLILTGSPSIKPNDIIILNDDETKMYGPILVREVTHILDSKLGFITIVTPGLMTSINDAYNFDNMAYICSFWSLPTWNPINLIVDKTKWLYAHAGSASDHMIKLMFDAKTNRDIWYPFIAMLNKVGMPLVIMPLIYNGTPYVVGLGDIDIYKYIHPFTKEIQDKRIEDLMKDLYKKKLSTETIFGDSMNNYIPNGGKNDQNP